MPRSYHFQFEQMRQTIPNLFGISGNGFSETAGGFFRSIKMVEEVLWGTGAIQFMETSIYNLLPIVEPHPMLML